MTDSHAHAQLETDRTPPLTAFQRDVVFVMYGLGQPNGQAIRRALEADSVYDDITQGRLYPNLKTLTEHGILRKGRLNRRANWWALTAFGEDVYFDLLKRGDRLATLADGVAE